MGGRLIWLAPVTQTGGPSGLQKHSQLLQTIKKLLQKLVKNCNNQNQKPLTN